MRTQATIETSSAFTPAEREALDRLRERYSQGRDLFSDRELARLRFLRWLYHTGRLTSWEDDRGYSDIVSRLWAAGRAHRARRAA
jgi:hypothetical protein